MNKKLLPLLLLATPFCASADATVYGRANVAVDWLDNGADYSELNISSNSSRIGFKASHDFDGVTALMQVEQGVQYDAGGVATYDRNTFLGVRGEHGTVRVGRFDTPFKRARGPANLFGEQIGDLRNFTRVGNARFDERNPNTIEYQSPEIGDLQINLALSVSENTTASEDASDEVISVSVIYSTGLLNLAGAFEAYGDDHSRGERDAIRLAGAFQLTPDWALIGFYQGVGYDGGTALQNDYLSSDVLGVGARYTLTEKTSLKGQYFLRSSDSNNADSDMFTLGVEHSLDKALLLYAAYGFVSNDDFAQLTPYVQGRGTALAADAQSDGVPAAPGETASGLSAGVRYTF